MEHLIPEAWFEPLGSPLLLLISAVALWVLSQGADWLVHGASELAYRSGLPKVIVGATIVSLGTTAPECAVSVMAAWQGNAGLALGNAVGSVIADTALIFGLGALLVPLPADRYVLSRQGWVQFGSAVLLAAICYLMYFLHGDQAVIPRSIGYLFLLLLAAYLAISVHWSRGHGVDAEAVAAVADVAPVPAIDEEPAPRAAPPPTRSFGMIVAGLLLVLVGSRVTIVCVSMLAGRFGVPEVVISATLVAFGTSLPELIVGMTSLRRGHPELLVGNVIGADVLNILFVTGAAAAAKPLPLIYEASLPTVFLWIHLPFMLVTLTYFRLCIFRAVRQGHFARWMGGPLVLTYVIYSVVQFLV
ncbi:Inner membrane protein YrbG [Maioricimonas rarisocia]|uniref:Inner membrane protein YrbG n=1 Tax=Maioricimonas rarisocia TaxID=2528026 RepID=A0A517ZFV3_9PLAN|nr:sodium:calcium antiporter [Maioricimonas rarisocia]QDU41322.1 Inner membrane protein YrbG [Maioricimonas rarisocia]